jgi:hypothetical protein
MSTVLAQVEAILDALPAAFFEDVQNVAAASSWSEMEWDTGLVMASLPARRTGWSNRLPWRRS